MDHQRYILKDQYLSKSANKDNTVNKMQKEDSLQDIINNQNLSYKTLEDAQDFLMNKLDKMTLNEIDFYLPQLWLIKKLNAI